MEKFSDLLNGRKKSNDGQNKFYKNYVLGTFVEHDEASCAAWKEYDSLPNPKRKDLDRIMVKYDTTFQKMKEHRECE
jgi:hypothetical protein